MSKLQEVAIFDVWAERWAWRPTAVFLVRVVEEKSAVLQARRFQRASTEYEVPEALEAVARQAAEVPEEQEMIPNLGGSYHCFEGYQLLLETWGKLAGPAETAHLLDSDVAASMFQDLQTGCRR